MIMRNALIHVMAAQGGGYEARLDPNWDGVATPGGDALRVSFDAVPEPPQGCADWPDFLLKTDGASPHFGTLGRSLHDLLVARGIGARLDRAPTGSLRLFLKVEPDELDALPWELMRKGDMPMFTDISRPVARVAASFNPDLELPKVCWPLRVMVVVGSEGGPVQIEEEIDHVRDGFRKVCGLVDLEVARLPDRAGVRELYKAMKPHVFHFVGHGGLDDQLGGYLRLDQKDAAPIQWTAAAVRDDLRDDPGDDFAGGDLRLAVLTACQSGDRTEHGGTRAVAAGLSELKVPAVIAMQGPIRGSAAARFAKGLYESLSTGMPLDRAVARARVEITDEAQINQREYALPSLILGAYPDRILDLSHGEPGVRLANEALDTVLSFVDRVPRRRQLWRRLQPDQPAGPRIFAVTGPLRAGKGSLVRWSLGMALVQGYPVVLADFPEFDYVDSVGFLDRLVTAPAAGGTDEVLSALASFGTDLEAYRSARSAAHATGGEHESPLGLYEKLSSILATATAEQTLVIGIDGLASVERGHWIQYAVPGFVRPVARGQVGNVRLIVALRENERAAFFPPEHFDERQIEDIPLQFFPPTEFVELASQRLRALSYTRESFKELVNGYMNTRIKAQGYWNTESFDLLDMHARVDHWAREA
jgi:CHAT domain